MLRSLLCFLQQFLAVSSFAPQLLQPYVLQLLGQLTLV
jgi:hypothetical protein